MFLPILNNEFTPTELFFTRNSYSISNAEQYHELCSELEEYIGADCHAFTIDNEVIFNSFEEELSFANQLKQDIYRDYLTRNIHSYLLCKINRRNRVTVFKIYMFRTNSYIVEVTFQEGIYSIRYLH